MKRQSLLSMFCLLTGAAIVGCLVGFVIGTWSIADVYATQENAQSQDKAIEQAYSSNPQVRITRLRAGQQVLRFNENFSEGEDWLRRLTFQLENTTNKPIVY